MMCLYLCDEDLCAVGLVNPEEELVSAGIAALEEAEGEG